MSLRLINALIAFNDFMNKVFKPFLDNFIIMFIDDIICTLRWGISFLTFENCVVIFVGKQAICKILKMWILNNKCYVLRTCYFTWSNTSRFIKGRGNKEWLGPVEVIEVWSLLRIVRYYKRFVKDFSKF